MNLKEIREKANLTQEQAGKLSDLSTRYISLLENGERNPSDKAKERLAKAYRVTIVEIFLAYQSTKRTKVKAKGD